MNHDSKYLGEQKISRLLLELSLPAALAMMINGLYNIVDTVFIGHGVGSDAIGGLAVAFPVQLLMMGFAQLVGIGSASIVSRSLGAKKVEEAEKVAGNGFFTVVILSLLVSFLSLIFVDELLYVFGATPELLSYARDYMQIILIGNVFFSFSMMSNNLIRAEGKAKIAMVSMLIGAILNIILDPIFIYPLDLGIKGAALATIISQFASFIFVVTYFKSGRSSLKIQIHHLKPKWEIITKIFSIGFSAFARSSTNSLFSIVVNNSLRFYGGSTAITIFGTINRVTSFLFMPIIGIGQGMQPILGYNYGAKKMDRAKKVIRLSLIVASIIAITGWVISETIPGLIMSIFTNDKELIRDGAKVFRFIILAMPLLGLQIIGSTLFQAIGKAIPALILSLLRQFILLIPLILILPNIYNLNLLGVWIAFPIADLLAGIIIYIFYKKQMAKFNVLT
ncbi:MAG TPA: MATE family efflux transporter [Haloplasmataceae bacterium]